MAFTDSGSSGVYIAHQLYHDGDKPDPVLRFAPYDANKNMLASTDEPVAVGDYHFLPITDAGTAGFIFVLVFFDDPQYNPPPGIGIVADGHGSGEGGGGGAGITIDGFGLSVSGSKSASVTVTGAFSQPFAAVQVDVKTYQTPFVPTNLTEFPPAHEWGYVVLGGTVENPTFEHLDITGDGGFFDGVLDGPVTIPWSSGGP